MDAASAQVASMKAAAERQTQVAARAKKQAEIAELKRRISKKQQEINSQIAPTTGAK
jgi:hypothetical protein